MSLPSKTSFNTTGFGVSKRELFIVGGGFIAMLLILAIPFAGLFIRILLGFAIMAGVVLFAMWRVHGHWTIEEWFIQKMKHQASKKRYIKGYSGTADEARKTYVTPDTVSEKEAVRADEESLFRLPKWLTPKSNAELVGYVLSTFTLVVILAWIGTSGMEEIANQINEIITSLRR